MAIRLRVAGICFEANDVEDDERILLPPPWVRFTPSCSPYNTFTPQQLAERRKAEVLKYKGNRSGKRTSNVADITTSKQRYVNAVRGRYLPHSSYASQTQQSTNNNIKTLTLSNGILLPTDVAANEPGSTLVGCPEPLSASDVPYAAGQPTTLQENKAVPVTMLFTRRTYPNTQGLRLFETEEYTDN